jgi:hypothetical protein
MTDFRYTLRDPFSLISRVCEKAALQLAKRSVEFGEPCDKESVHTVAREFIRWCPGYSRLSEDQTEYLVDKFFVDYRSRRDELEASNMEQQG